MDPGGNLVVAVTAKAYRQGVTFDGTNSGAGFDQDLTGTPGSGRAGRWGRFMRREATLSIGIGLLVLIIWAGSEGGRFWPVWVWFGLGVPLLVQASIRWGLRCRPYRFLAVHGSVSAALAVVQLVIWLLTGLGYFWPMWPIMGFAALFGLHLWISRPPMRHQAALAERVNVLTRTRTDALDVQAAELRRIERDLHDGAQARLVSLGMTLGLAEELVHARPEQAAELLSEARYSTMSALDDLRTVMRGIQPPVLSDRGLEGAVQALALDLAVPVSFSAKVPGRAPLPVESAVYFAVAECLANVVKHSQATAAWVTIWYSDGGLCVEVGDNGRGGANFDGGTGLRGIWRRLEPFDGQTAVCSPLGGPTMVTMKVPCELSLPKT